MQLFKIDGPVFRFLETVANLIILNILFLICSIPIVTIGPALTATYYVTLKIIRGEEIGITKNFFHSFRENFKQGLVLGVGVILLAALLLLDIHALVYLITIPKAIADILLFAVGLILLVLVLIAVYIFAVLAQFDNKTSELIKWSAIIAVRHFPITLLSVAMAAVPVIFFCFFPGIFVQTIMPIMLLMGFSGIAYLQSYFYVRVFAYYIPAEEEENSEDT